VAYKYISPAQTAFVPRRHVDGVVLFHEILQDLKCSNKTGIVLKFDFEKAYDKALWSFLVEDWKYLEVLNRKGFFGSNKLCKLGRVGINLNGENGVYFKAYKV
jgi:hypothetical protein